MPFLDEPEPPRRSSHWGLIALVIVLLAIAGGVGYWLTRPPAPRPAPPVTRPAPVQPAAPVVKTPVPAPAPAPRRRVRRRPAPKPAPVKPAPAPAPTTGTLTVQSDVAGAMVFLDRRYVGKTPATASDLDPGSHHLSVSTPGYDTYDKTIDIKAGAQQVEVRFKQVSLDESIQVVHKHLFGSDKGTLRATPDGLQYITAKPKDGFTVPFSRLEVFKVDYLKNNLEIKIRGGKTYNFTEQKGGPNVLFVFHQKTEHAIEMLKKLGKLK